MPQETKQEWFRRHSFATKGGFSGLKTPYSPVKAPNPVSEGLYSGRRGDFWPMERQKRPPRPPEGALSVEKFHVERLPGEPSQNPQKPPPPRPPEPVGSSSRAQASRCHVERGFSMSSASIAISDGVIPLIRPAWPRVAGRILASFWRASARRLRTRL